MINGYAVLCSFVLLTGVDCLVKKEIPSYVTICKRNDPEIEKCLRDNVEVMKPYLVKGIPEMRLPSIEPFFFPEISIGLNNFQATFRNVSVHGASNFTLKDLKVDLENLELVIETNFPVMNLASNYTLKGRILFLDVAGAGYSTNEVSDVNAKIVIKGERLEKNGNTYLASKNRTINLEIGNSKIYFYNLFENEELTVNTNRVINENIQEFIKELRPVVEEAIGSVIYNIVSKVFRSFTIEQLFPL